MSKHTPESEPPHDNEPLREHVFDGIQEYDNKLPNWWLMTFYGSILFSIVYWLFYHTWEVGLSPEEKLARQQADLAAQAAAAGLEEIDDDALFEASRDESLVEAGRNAYASSCAACHGADLEGGIGSALRNAEWAHGERPMEIRANILDGIPAVGMPPWRQSLGERQVNAITAFLLSVNPDLVPDGEPENESDP